jgi:hypothetical protein
MTRAITTSGDGMDVDDDLTFPEAKNELAERAIASHHTTREPRTKAITTVMPILIRDNATSSRCE